MISEHNPAKQNADQGEKRHINPNQPRKIPFDGIHHQPITTQHGAAEENKEQVSSSQASPDRGISRDLQERREDEYEPNHDFIPDHYAPVEAGSVSPSRGDTRLE